MKQVKVYNMGKLDTKATRELSKSLFTKKRLSLREIIERRKRSERDARLVQMF